MILKHKVVKVRKPQYCWGCSEEYQKGSFLTCVVEAKSGEIQNTYWCKLCMEFMNRFGYALEDGISLGELRDSYYTLDMINVANDLLAKTKNSLEIYNKKLIKK